MKYILIGGSIACYGAILGIKSVDAAADITVFCGERTELYSRPLISYWLEGKTTEENLCFRGSDFYCKNNVNTILYKVTEINPKKRTVKDEQGKTYSYDKLFFGCGSYPFVPPFPGLDKVKNKTCFYTLADARALKEMLTPTTKLLIVGAGLIGLKCAEGCYPTTKDITIVDMQPRVLPNATTPAVGEILARKLEEKGIRLRLGAGVASFEENAATLTTGERIAFDAVVLAIGVRPETEPLKSAGARVNRGIVVDKFMRTNLDGIYCAGDCAEGYEAITGENRLLQLFPSAYKGGYVAGRNMAGASEELTTDVPMNSTSMFGLKFTSCGIYDGEERATEKDGNYRALYIKDNRLVGYILVGDTARAGIYTKIIAQRIPLDVLGEEILERPSLMPFGKDERDKFLAEEV